MEWLPAPTMAPCIKGLVKAIQCVLIAGMLDPVPETRPQTVEAAREFLQEALRAYELLETADNSQKMLLSEEGEEGVEYDSG